MIHEVLTVGALQMNCSIFGDPASGEAMVIDPGDEIERIWRALDRHGLRVTRIVFTHTHIDHVGAAAELQRRSGAPVAMHPSDLPVYDKLEQQAEWLGVPTPERAEISRWLREGETLTVGSAAFEVRLTPGHSPGSISLWIPDLKKVVTGDALFKGSIGRTDLPGGNHKQLVAAIHAKLMTLADDVAAYPGHGGKTTIGAERRGNPFLA
jgi:glyoxylase-like metal-dependent hydrolase (beta-lactamase superfamily II)